MSLFKDAIVPNNLCVYAVGDIHGRCDLLSQLLGLIGADTKTRPEGQACVVFLGDYIDRGGDSAGVLTLLAELASSRGPYVFLMGNHEEILLKFLDGDVEAGTAWLKNGGKETLQSYGIDPQSLPDLHDLRDALGQAIPASHVEFIRTQTVGFHIEGDFAFVHAGIRPGRRLRDQDLADLLWMREPFLSSRVDHGYVIVHGHTPVLEPEAHPNRVNLDTGSGYWGKLSALALESTRQRFLTVGPSPMIAETWSPFSPLQPGRTCIGR